MKHPVMEIFGPVLQGEGMMIGYQTMFVRFGGCDLRCEMCDSKRAVTATSVRENATWMDADEIHAGLRRALQARGYQEMPTWITLSGGNPCLHDLSTLVDNLKFVGHLIAVETQGTMWKDWLTVCNIVTVSPKGPGMQAGKIDWDGLSHFYNQLKNQPGFNFKIVVFNEKDLEFACTVRTAFPNTPFFLSIGNKFLPEMNIDFETQQRYLLNKLSWAEEVVPRYPVLKEAIVLPQLHVLTHGNAQGW